jgi:hypothetical protein
MCIAFGEDRPATSCDIPTVTTLDRGYAAATIADGELRLSVGPESIPNDHDGRGFLFRYSQPGDPGKV